MTKNNHPYCYLLGIKKAVQESKPLHYQNTNRPVSFFLIERVLFLNTRFISFSKRRRLLRFDFLRTNIVRKGGFFSPCSILHNMWRILHTLHLNKGGSFSPL